MLVSRTARIIEMVSLSHGSFCVCHSMYQYPVLYPTSELSLLVKSSAIIVVIDIDLVSDAIMMQLVVLEALVDESSVAMYMADTNDSKADIQIE